VGFGGVGLALAGLSIPIVGWLGGALIGGAVVRSLYNAVPPPLIDIKDVIWKKINLSDLDLLSVRPPIIAIVGPTLTGKSTLSDLLPRIDLG
jgi:polynucleotide 5'-kinase involved in rRNA processing